MTPDEADAQLVRSLEQLRKRFDENADDWRYSLLRTFRKYLRAKGVERRLIDPVEKMILEIGDSILLARRRAGGQTGKRKPAGSTLALSYAAAAVTTLNQRHGWTLPGAISRIAKASGIPVRDLKTFRDNLHRGHNHVPGGAHEAYDMALAEMRDLNYGPDEIMEAVKGIAIFGD